MITSVVHAGVPVGRGNGVDLELREGGVDAVGGAGGLIDVERLVVRHAAECGLRGIRAADVDRIGELEELLPEVGHLLRRVRFVERDGVSQRLAGHRHTRARGEVVAQIDLEVVDEHQELAVARREGEAGGVEIDERRARSRHRLERVVEERGDVRVDAVDPLSRRADARALEARCDSTNWRVVGRERRPGRRRRGGRAARHPWRRRGHRTSGWR